MKKLWLRITLGFFLISIFGLGIIWFFMSSINRDSYEELIETHLTENSAFISSSIEAINLDINDEATIEWFKKLDFPKDMRYTLIDKDGTVLFDNENKYDVMENHLERPEVVSAFKLNDTSHAFIRYSATEEIDMMYVAEPLYKKGEVIGVIRTATPLYTIDASVKKIWWTLLLVLAFILVASLIAAAFLSYNITKPINKIIGVTNRLKHQDYSARVTEKYSGELGDLGESINVLASSLHHHVAEIEDQSKQLESILSNLVTGVILINPEGQIEMINTSAERLIHKERSKLIMSHYRTALLHLNIDRMIRKVRKLDEPKQREVYLYTPDERVLDIHVAPYYGQRWEKRGVIITLNDITRLKHLENVRRDFVANVSHELKTPVTSVKGFAETLLQNTSMPPETEREFIQIIYDESERLNTIINDLLNLSKIEKNDLALDIQQVDLVKLIHKTSRSLHKAFSDKDLTLILPDDKGVKIFADKDRLSQIFVNLLSNAINYTPVGGQVSVTIQKFNGDIEIKVKDNGIGIKEESIDRLFERFYRVDTARSRNQGGTGLGLSIVKHLIDLHGGSIKIDSVLNEYTEVTVRLPIEP